MYSFVEDGVTFTLSVTNGTGVNVNYSLHNIDAGSADAEATLSLTFAQGGNPVSFTGNPGLGFSAIGSGTISVFTTAGTWAFGTVAAGVNTVLGGQTITSIQFTLSAGGPFS